MSFDFYKVLHFSGIFMVFSALGGQILQAINGGDPRQLPGRKWIAILHGVGLTIVLVAGFGMIAKLGIGFAQPWIIGKLLIWVVLGGIGAVAARKKNLAGMIWVLVLLLGLSAAYLAHYKPGA
ncbi:MAG: hypothetical protein EOP10_25450 [Proteobacteria bacterium]|nr:MAG: hypothetical protein EOP10_25450 [Pseudomonadota bacterium]